MTGKTRAKSLRSLHWDEAKHPRDNEGKFSRKAGSKWLAKVVRQVGARFGDVGVAEGGREPQGRLSTGKGSLIDLGAISRGAKERAAARTPATGAGGVPLVPAQTTGAPKVEPGSLKVGDVFMRNGARHEVIAPPRTGRQAGSIVHRVQVRRQDGKTGPVTLTGPVEKVEAPTQAPAASSRTPGGMVAKSSTNTPGFIEGISDADQFDGMTVERGRGKEWNVRDTDGATLSSHLSKKEALQARLDKIPLRQRSREGRDQQGPTMPSLDELAKQVSHQESVVAVARGRLHMAEQSRKALRGDRKKIVSQEERDAARVFAEAEAKANLLRTRHERARQQVNTLGLPRLGESSGRAPGGTSVDTSRVTRKTGGVTTPSTFDTTGLTERQIAGIHTVDPEHRAEVAERFRLANQGEAERAARDAVEIADLQAIGAPANGETPAMQRAKLEQLASKIEGGPKITNEHTVEWPGRGLMYSANIGPLSYDDHRGFQTGNGERIPDNEVPFYIAAYNKNPDWGPMALRSNARRAMEAAGVAPGELRKPPEDVRPEREQLQERLKNLRDRVRHVNDYKRKRDMNQTIIDLENRLDAIDLEERKAKVKEFKKGDLVKGLVGMNYEVVGTTKDGYLRVQRPDGKRASINPTSVERVAKPEAETPSFKLPGTVRREATADKVQAAQDALSVATTRAEGDAAVADMTTTELRHLAEKLNVHIGGMSKSDAQQRIVERAVGSRLNSAAIRDRGNFAGTGYLGGSGAPEGEVRWVDKAGRPVTNPSQVDIVRGNVVRDTEEARAERVARRAAIPGRTPGGRTAAAPINHAEVVTRLKAAATRAEAEAMLANMKRPDLEKIYEELRRDQPTTPFNQGKLAGRTLAEAREHLVELAVGRNLDARAVQPGGRAPEGRRPGDLPLDTSRVPMKDGGMQATIERGPKGRTTTITLPDGTTEKRTSKTRDYTHAVVITEDNHAHAAEVQALVDRRKAYIEALEAWVARGSNMSELKAYNSANLSMAEREAGRSKKEYYLPGFEPVQKTIKASRYAGGGGKYWEDGEGFSLPDPADTKVFDYKSNTDINGKTLWEVYGPSHVLKSQRGMIEREQAEADKLRTGPQYGYGVWRWSGDPANAQSYANSVATGEGSKPWRTTRVVAVEGATGRTAEGEGAGVPAFDVEASAAKVHAGMSADEARQMVDSMRAPQVRQLADKLGAISARTAKLDYLKQRIITRATEGAGRSPGGAGKA
jgi:hypothetical protein